MEWTGEKLIGKVRQRFEEVFAKENRWDEYRSFYNGWLEGRVDMMQELKDDGLLIDVINCDCCGETMTKYADIQGIKLCSSCA